MCPDFLCFDVSVRPRLLQTLPPKTKSYMTSVYLECISEKKKLRMRVISDGYRSDLNCTFPKDARVEGAFYAVDHSQVSHLKSLSILMTEFS